MLTEHFPVHVLVERRPAATRWADHVWRAVTVLPGLSDAAPWTVLSEDSGTTRFLAGNAAVEAHPGETAAHRDNLGSPTPSVYVILRPAGPPVGWTLLAVTIDPTEAQAHVDSGTDLVEALPMPPSIRLWLDRFVARHHVDRPTYKRQRDRSEKQSGRRDGQPPEAAR